MRVVSAVEVLSANHRDIQFSHWALNEVSVGVLGFDEVLLCLLQSRIVCKDVRLNFGLTLDQLVLS